LKLDRTFLIDELSKVLGDHVEAVAKEHMIGLVNDYNETLRKQGMYIEFRDQEELVKHLLGSANIKLKIAAELDEAKLDKWHIYPQSVTQTKLMEYEERAAHEAERRQRMNGQAGSE
jgi:hypothetical protein